MSNSLTAAKPLIWGKKMQAYRQKKQVAIAVCNNELKDDLKVGYRAYKPYSNYLTDAAYTKGSDVSPQDIRATAEYLEVDTARVVPFYYDDLDKAQDKWDQDTIHANMAMQILNNKIDGAVQNQYANAADSLDDGDIGGTANNYLTLEASNVNQLFIAAGAKLDNFDVEDNNRVCLAPPRMLQAIRLLLSNKDTQFGDKIGENGFINRWAGFDIFKTNNAPMTFTLATANQITAGDTLTMAGVVFTFVALGTAAAAGDIALGSTAAATTDNIVAAINGTDTPSATTYVEVDDSDREKLRRNQVEATDATTSITFTAKGEVTMSETLTNTDNVFSAQRQHVIFMERGAIDLVQQRMPYVQFNQAQLRAGKFVLAICLFGIKTFKMGTRAILDCRINASNWS